jgi:hypothetical protein
MLKRTLILLALVSAVGTGFPSAALASRTIAGRITAYSATSLSVIDKEVLTVEVDDRTTYTKLITQKPWEEDTRLSASALGVGRFVAVHMRRDNPNLAEWVQVGTDMRPVALATTTSSATSATLTALSTAPESRSKSSDLLPSKQLKELIATAKTPADHLKVQKHFLALAGKYEADASEHAAEAQAYRQNPSFMDSKHPANPGTAAHCDRLAELDREAAKEARDLASAHERMAAAK